MFALLITLVVMQRLTELVIAARNRRWLLARGAIECGRGHYPVMVAMHVLFYTSLILEHRFASRGWDPLWLWWLAVLLLAQALRVWVQLTLGRFWTTRILVLPGAKPVRRGPYRFIRHPNYVVVALELLSLPMLCGALHRHRLHSDEPAMLSVRIREEERALAKWMPGQPDSSALHSELES
jgi:methyltransferase